MTGVTKGQLKACHLYLSDVSYNVQYLAYQLMYYKYNEITMVFIEVNRLFMNNNEVNYEY